MMYRDLEIYLGLDRLTLHIDESLYTGRNSWNTQRHCNGDFELHMILLGACIVDVQSQPHGLQDSDALLIAPGQYHCPHVLPGDFLRMSVSFSVAQPARATALSQALQPCRKCRLADQALRLCQDIFREMQTDSALQAEMLTALFSQLLIHIFRSVQLCELPMPHKRPAGADWRTCVIDDFFEHNLTEYGAKEQLAQLLHLSQRQLTRVLQTHYGMGFRQKLAQARMDYAAWLLRTTDKKILEIQQLAGYASETAFFQAFQLAFHTTPLQYRRTVVLRSKP